jgi:hypothetical protein
VLIGFSVVAGLILGILKSRKTKPKTSDNRAITDGKKDRELRIEDSESDGPMSEGEILFPPESFDDENEF